MIDFILGKDIATYVRAQRGLVVLALVLTLGMAGLLAVEELS